MVLFIDLQQYLQFLFIHEGTANMCKSILKWLSDFIVAINKYQKKFVFKMLSNRQVWINYMIRNFNRYQMYGLSHFCNHAQMVCGTK